MSTLEQRTELILESEERFADALARCVIEKPKLSVWMILIPLLLIYYMYRWPQYTEGRKQFVENYLMIRRKALREAYASVSEGRPPDVEGISSSDDVPADVRPQMRKVLSVLVEHFAGLLRTDGADVDTMIRSAYGGALPYLLVLNKLNQEERALYAALTGGLNQDPESVDSAVRLIGDESERLRREAADRIFS